MKDQLTLNFDNFQSFLNKATDAITCNPECQRAKMEENLKQQYLNAKTNLISAPNQVQTTEKNYVTFTQGKPAYDELLDRELTAKADLIVQEYKTRINEEIKDIQSLIKTYISLCINFKNSFELFVNYKTENVELLKELKENTNDVLTNERKTYYQDQGIDSLNFFYSYIFLIVYIIFIICFGIFSFIFPSDIKWYIRLIIFIGFIILPFVSTKLLSMVIWFFYKIYEVLPRNVHLNEAK